MSKKLGGELVAAAVVGLFVFWVAPSGYDNALQQPLWALKAGACVALACIALASWRGAIPWGKLVTKRALVIEVGVLTIVGLGVWWHYGNHMSPAAVRLNDLVEVWSRNSDRERSGEATKSQAVASYVAAENAAVRDADARVEVLAYRRRHDLFCPSFLEMGK